MNTRIISLLLTLAQVPGLYAQMPIFRVKPVKEIGTAQMSTVFQDSRGWLWFGGDGGLFRFDGQAFQTVSLPDSLPGDPISALFESDERLWVGFRSGAIGYLPSNAVFLTAPPGNSNNKSNRHPSTPLRQWMPEEGTPKHPVIGFCRDSTGNLWIATYGEGLYCWSNNRLYQFDSDDGLAGSDIYAITCDGLGRVWAATDAGISVCSMPAPGQKRIHNLGKAEGLPDEIVPALLTDQNGDIWIGTYDRGVCRYHVRQNTFEFVLDDWPYGPVSALAAFGSRELWVGTAQNGLIRLGLNPRPGSRTTVSMLPDNHPLRRQKIQTVLKDREGLLWVLEHKGAIYSANVRIGMLLTPFREIQAVWADQSGRLWAGTPDGLFCRTAGEFRQVLPGRQNILSLWEAPNGDLWAGTFGNGVFILGPDGKVKHQLTEKEGLTNGSVLSITGNADQVWLATLGGVTKIDLAKMKPVTFQDELGAGYVYKVLVDRNGRVWFGTDGEGLIVLDNGAFRRFPEAAGVPLKTIYSIAEDREGRIWFSTEDSGLFEYDGQQFKQYTMRNHLHSMSMTGLAVDGNGYLVIAYEDGVDVLTPQTGHVTFFDASSGAPTAETNFNALCRDASGNLWLGAHQGILRLAAFDEPFMYDPEPNITAISIFLQPVDFLATTVFAYDQNYFLFNFTGLWYTNPDLVRYRYRVDGSDHDWIVSKEHFASYPNLPPGHYTFRLQASEHGEFEGTPEVRYSFTIRAPFWRQWWFFSLCLMALGALLYLFVHAREARFHREAALRRESVESQFAVLKSQINPHFLFNSFNTLITIIEENPTMAVEYVEHLSDFYRSIMVYREKDLITLNEEMEIVRNFDFLLQKRYEDSFRLNGHVNGQAGQVMPLTLQMLVENAVKHNVISRTKPLTVDIFVESDGYVVVRNNKQPKLKPEPSTHFGLQSLVNRYAMLGARSVIVEETDQYFTVKVPIL